MGREIVEEHKRQYRDLLLDCEGCRIIRVEDDSGMEGDESQHDEDAQPFDVESTRDRCLCLVYRVRDFLFGG